VESDFQRYYGLNLREELWGENPIGMRRFQALVRGLPLDSSLVRSQDPKRLGVGWNSNTELLAVIAQVIDNGNRLFYQANFKGSMPKPLKIVRPWEDKTKPTTDVDTIKSFMAQTGVHIPLSGEEV